MATYPTLPTSFGSDPRPLNSLAIDRAEDGSARGRDLFSNDKVSMVVKHEWLTAAQKSTLDAFYSANRRLVFVYVSPTDGLTRNMLFANPVAYTRKFGDYWDASVSMAEA